MRRFPRLMILCCTLVGVAAAQPPVQDGQLRTGIVAGRVTNLNGIPLAKAEVMIVNTDLRVMTSDSGVFEFLAAPTGRLRVIARRIGFEPDEMRIIVEVGKLKQVDFELKGIPEQLDSVMVREASSNGRLGVFWARRLVGNGAFLTHDEIARRRPQRSSDLLRMVTGVRVTAGESGFEHPQITMGRNPILSRQGNGSSPSSSSACRVTYYIDGAYVPPGTFHLDDMSPLSIEAMEIYRGPAETPTALRQRDTACGVIVIYTRDPSRRDPGSANEQE